MRIEAGPGWAESALPRADKKDQTPQRGSGVTFQPQRRLRQGYNTSQDSYQAGPHGSAETPQGDSASGGAWREGGRTRGDQGLKPHTHQYTRTHVCTIHMCTHAYVPICGPRLPLDGLWPRGRMFQRMGPLGPGSPYSRAREQLGCRRMDSRPLCSHPRGPLPSPPSARQAASAWRGPGGERRRGHRASSTGRVGCGGGRGLGLAEVEAQAPRPPVDTPLC